MAKYILNEPYALRGWTDEPYALINAKTGETEPISAAEADALDICNGRIDLSGPLIPNEMRQIALEFLDYGIVRESAGALKPYQRLLIYPTRRVSAVQWAITGRCNYKCRHCFLSAPSGKAGEKPLADCLKLIEDFERCGIRRVSLTGGEPLLRADFIEIVRALRSAGIGVDTIYTNGALVTERLLDELDKLELKPEFNMSYDGFGYHDWLRNIRGAQDAVEAAFKLLRARGFATGAEYCLTRMNAGALAKSVRRLAELGCGSLKVNPVAAQGEWLTQEKTSSLSGAEALGAFLDYIPKFFSDGAPLDLMLGGFFLYQRESDACSAPIMKRCGDFASARICEHARRQLYIDSDFRALPCASLAGMALRHDFPIIKPGALEEVLNDSEYSKAIDTRVSEYMARHPECAACEYALDCAGGCRASALSGDSADYLTRDEATCEIYRGGWLVKLNQLLEKLNRRLAI